MFSRARRTPINTTLMADLSTKALLPTRPDSTAERLARCMGMAERPRISRLRLTSMEARATGSTSSKWPISNSNRRRTRLVTWNMPDSFSKMSTAPRCPTTKEAETKTTGGPAKRPEERADRRMPPLVLMNETAQRTGNEDTRKAERISQRTLAARGLPER